MLGGVGAWATGTIPSPGARVGLTRLAGLELELSRLLQVRIDLRTARDLSERFRPEVLAEAEVLYAAA